MLARNGSPDRSPLTRALGCALALSLAACGESQPDRDAGPSDVLTRPPDADAAVTGDLPACSACGDYALVTRDATLTDNNLDELSGIVESRRRAGVFFVHNDSGDRARFFAIDVMGALIAEYRLRDATADDIEDIAVGPCGADTCLYLGDIGDNAMARTSYVIYRVREPEVVAANDPEEVTWDALRFRYPDGSHNAETLLAHPTTGDLYVVTKVERGLSGVYRLAAGSHDAGETALTRVGELALPTSGGVLVTGGDLHPCADRLLVRTYLRLFEYVRPEGQPFEAIFGVAPRQVPVASERQGEAVGWRANGRGYVTVSEGTGAALNLYGCE